MERGISVLIIDDDRRISEIYGTALIWRGCRVLTAYDGEAGLKIAREQKPSVVMLDLALPKIDGIEVLRRLRGDGATSEIPVIIVTNLTRGDYRQVAEKLGASGYFVKAESCAADIWGRIAGILNRPPEGDAQN